MVGVAGRSRGCKTCRRRRVKCDEHHPTCKRCEKAGYTCEGYQDRNFIIFDNTIKHENAIQSYKSSKDSDSHSDISEAPTDFNSLSPRSISTELTKIDDSASPIGNVPLFVSPIVDRENLYTSFMYKYFYRGAETRLKLFEAPGADLNLRNSLASMSAGALSTSFFGFKTGTQAIMIDGQHQYGMALSKLNQALNHRSPKDDCDVLAAIVMLCLYEFMMPASITGWMSHALGLGTMFKLLGPEICSQDPYHTYFETCRVLIVYAQLTLRLDSFLADKEWTTIPWLTKVQGKSPMEGITDILAQLCRVQKYWDDVVKQKEQDRRIKFRARYDQQLERCFRDLENWASLHKAFNEGRRNFTHYHTIGTILDDGGSKKKETNPRPALFETVYDYVDLESANLICLYHAIYILLTIFVHNAPTEVFNGFYPPLSPPPPMDSPIHEAFFKSGVEIGKSTDFHLQEHQDSAGSFHLVFPMRMAARAFEEIQMTNETKWANGILTGIANGANRQWAFAGQVIRENGQDVYTFRQ